MATAEWTVLEKLLLSQAVYKYGEDNWFQIARNLKHHALLDRPSDYFNQKNCSLQYYLMVEDLTKEKRNALNQDMPVVVQIARQLYTTRLEELKKAIHDDEEKFLILVNEIDEIRAGKWDQRLLDQYRQQQHTMTPNGSLSNKLPESEATTSTEINAEKVKEMKEAETPSAAEITAATAVSPSVTRANEQNVADENTTEDVIMAETNEKSDAGHVTSEETPVITTTPQVIAEPLIDEINSVQSSQQAALPTATETIKETGQDVVKDKDTAEGDVENANSEAKVALEEDIIPISASTATNAAENLPPEPKMVASSTTATAKSDASPKTEDDDATNPTAVAPDTAPQTISAKADGIDVKESTEQSTVPSTERDILFKKQNSNEAEESIISSSTSNNQDETNDIVDVKEAELPVTSTTAEKVDKRGTIADGQQFQTDTSAKESKQEQNKAETAMTAPMEQDQLQTQSANTSEHLSAGVTEWSDSGRVLKRQADDHSMVVEPESKRLKRDSMSISIPIEGASSLPEQQHQQYYTPPSLSEEDVSKKQKQDTPLNDVDTSELDYSANPANQLETPINFTITGESTESAAATESNAPTPATNISTNTHSAAATPTASAATTPHTTTTTPTADRKSKGNLKDDPRHKSWQKNINLLWREIANHKNGAMFMNPIKESIAPRYYEIVKRPMELKTIKNRIRDGSISTTTEFERDVVLMLNNSLMYNKEGTEVYLLAREMLDDALEQIRVFKTADTESSASSHTRAAAMAAKADRRKSTIPE